MNVLVNAGDTWRSPSSVKAAADQPGTQHADEPPHPHHAPQQDDLSAVLDPAVPDGELSPADVSRRGFLRRVGLLGAGAATASVLGPSTAAAHAATSDGRTGRVALARGRL